MAKFYKIVRYCRGCKKRFFVESHKDTKHYCTDCFKKYNAYYEKKAKEEEEAEKLKEAEEE